MRHDYPFRLTFQHLASRTRAVCTVSPGQDDTPPRLVVSIRNPDSLSEHIALQYQALWFSWFGRIGSGTDSPLPTGWELQLTPGRELD